MTAHILLVDDEPDARELFRQNFRREIRRHVYALDFADSGEAALGTLRAQDDCVAVVLSDINMPGMSGIELLAEIRRAWPDLPVVMITAYGDAATEAKALALGAQCFLTKPVDFEQLRQAVARLVGALR